MQTRSNHPSTELKSGEASYSKRVSPQLAPPGVWDRDPLEDATGASLLTSLPDSLAADALLVRAWLGSSSRIGAPLVVELDLAGIDPWNNEVRAWLSHVGSWNLARTSSGAVMHCWLDERDIRRPTRLVSHIEELLRAVRARIIAYEGFGQRASVPSDHARAHQRLEELWQNYRSERRVEASRVPKELIELAMRVARHEARRLRPNLPAHSDQTDVEARAVLSVFESIDQAWRSERGALVPRIRRGVRWVVLDELHGEAQLTQEERALLGIDSLKISLEDIEPDEEEVDVDGLRRPSQPPTSNPRWAPCDHLSNSNK